MRDITGLKPFNPEGIAEECFTIKTGVLKRSY
jgi:hypothetical protein